MKAVAANLAGRRESRRASRKSLTLVLAFTALFMVVEVAGGLLTHSLALLADAGHMASDVAALLLAVAASWYSIRPATARRSWGYYRLEILAALGNGLLLGLIAAYIVWEAYHRIQAPPAVKSVPMLIIATLGLGVNLGAALILVRQRASSLNVQGAFLHVIGDALGSGGAILAALVMLFTGWYLADPIISIVITLIILFSAWRLIHQTVDILMESTPRHIDPYKIRDRLMELQGVKDVHDLHIWTLTTGFVAMSGHVVLSPKVDGLDGEQGVLLGLRHRLKQEFGIDHATVQLETKALPDESVHCAGDPTCLA
ncbi:MAG: cation transporter [Chloroflexi bacterium]|nr:cation transporter [Chloroflexota bacterium]